MKTSVFLACMFSIFAVALSDREVAEGLAESFEISDEDADRCVNKNKLTKQDIKQFVDEVNDLNLDTIDRSAVRRASCTVACTAQVAGWMKGPKIQIAKIHARLDTLGAPDRVIEKLHSSVNICSLEAKDKEDECDVVHDFVKCLVKKEIHFGW